MRCLKRNMTEFQYLPYAGTETDLNSDGEHTGEFHREYGTPVTYKGNISSPSGQVNPTFYGDEIRYTHTLVMDNPDVEIKEDGLINWKNDLYEILSKKPSLNAISFALRKLTTYAYVPYVPDSTDGDD